MDVLRSRPRASPNLARRRQRGAPPSCRARPGTPVHRVERRGWHGSVDCTGCRQSIAALRRFPGRDQDVRHPGCSPSPHRAACRLNKVAGCCRCLMVVGGRPPRPSIPQLDPSTDRRPPAPSDDASVQLADWPSGLRVAPPGRHHLKLRAGLITPQFRPGRNRDCHQPLHPSHHRAHPMIHMANP